MCHFTEYEAAVGDNHARLAWSLHASYRYVYGNLTPSCAPRELTSVSILLWLGRQMNTSQWSHCRQTTKLNITVVSVRHQKVYLFWVSMKNDNTSGYSQEWTDRKLTITRWSYAWPNSWGVCEVLSANNGSTKTPTCQATTSVEKSIETVICDDSVEQKNVRTDCLITQGVISIGNAEIRWLCETIIHPCRHTYTIYRQVELSLYHTNIQNDSNTACCNCCPSYKLFNFSWSAVLLLSFAFLGLVL